MTTLREAAQQALEALEYHVEQTRPIWKTSEAIAALEAALAESAQEPDPGEYHGWVLREVLFDNGEPVGHREPVQEPVAKVELMLTGGNAGLATRIVEIDDHLRERLRPGQLLYTAPPQQALTIERLRDALVASRIIPPAAVEDPDEYDDGVTLFRIEALHRRIT